MAENTIPGEATRSGRKTFPTLKRKAVEVVKSHKKTSNIDPAKKNKASTSKKKKDKALTPPNDSDIEVKIPCLAVYKIINISIRSYPEMRNLLTP